MTHTEAQKQIAKLRDQIRRHDHLYYVEATPEISDFDYDKLYSQLQKLETDFPDLVTPDSPTQRVGGAPLKQFRSVTHALPMLSLEKSDTLDGLRKFDADIHSKLPGATIEYVLEPKIDGVSISARYELGQLVLGATRGDGQTGDDITANIKTIRAIPLSLSPSRSHAASPIPEVLEVRGEAYMPIDAFEKLNATLRAAGEKTFPNPRNATAGTLKQLDPRIVATRPLSVVFYAVGECSQLPVSTHAEVLNYLKSLGLPTPQHWWLCPTMDDLIERYDKEIVAGNNESKDLRTRVPYELDGIVVKVNSLAQQQRIPAKARAPGYAIVYKPEHWIKPAETKLNAITIQVGRTGTLTPVAELEPVFVQGSTVSRATLHNEEEIKRKDIRIGDTVIIRKAGMVIPEVVEVMKEKRPKHTTPFDFVAHIHNKCPACGGPIHRDPRYVTATCHQKVKGNRICGHQISNPNFTGGKCPKCGSQLEREAKYVDWICDNISCPAQLKRSIEHFAMRRAMDIQGLGESIIAVLVDQNFIRDVADLYSLTREQLDTILRSSNEKRDFAPILRNLLRRLDILDAPTLATKLGRHFASFDDLLSASRVQWQEALDGDGTLAGHVHSCFHDERNSHLVDHYRAEFEGKAATNLYEAIQASKKRELWRLIHGLGIPDVGEEGSRKLSSHFGHLDKLASATCQDIQDVQDVGPVVAASIRDFFDNERNKLVLDKIRAANVNLVEKSASTHSAISPFSGKTVVVTGTLEGLSRDEVKDALRKAGAIVTDSISKKTDFLVVGDKAGSKLDKAQKLGIQTLDEQQFKRMLSETPKDQAPRHGQSELF